MFRKEVRLNDRDEILSQLTEILEEMFEIDAAAISPGARLYDDLDIDSIDAVDLVARLRSITGKKIDPEMFKAARTVEDVVEAVFRLVNS
jgi:acyl carrier protein